MSFSIHRGQIHYTFFSSESLLLSAVTDYLLIYRCISYKIIGQTLHLVLFTTLTSYQTFLNRDARTAPEQKMRFIEY